MKKKLPIIIVGIVILVVLIVGLVFILGGKKNQNANLSVEYVGGDKFIGQTVSNEDFQVVYLPTNTKLDVSDFIVKNTTLALDGTNVQILYTTPNGEMVSTEIMVYPTLTISSIKADLINKDKFVGSTLNPEDFKVSAIDNKGNEYNITNFKITPNKLENEETDVTISYNLNDDVFTSTIHIKTGENYFNDLDVQFIGTKNFIGQNVTNDDFIVKAVYADGQESAITDFQIVNPTLTEEKSTITISAKNSKDEIITKDIEVEGKNYVTDIDSILYIGDAQTVGNSISIDDFEIYGLKSDNSKTKLKNCKIESGAKLETNSNQVKISYYNELGELLYGDCLVKADDNIIFIGDCRVSNLKKLESNENSEDVCYYISSKKANYKWFRDVAIPKAQSIMDKNVYTKFRVVINLGLFDTKNEEKYVKLFKSLASDKWSKHKIYALSLNPIDEAQMEQSKIYSRKTTNTSKIKEFNLNLAKDIGSDISNLKYVNTNGSIINNGYKTIDGINYDEETLRFYYDLVKQVTY